MKDYWEQVKNKLSEFMKDGDVLKYAGHYLRQKSTCQLCFHYPITHIFTVKNETSRTELAVGSECIRVFISILPEEVIDLIEFENVMKKDASEYREIESGLRLKDIEEEIERQGREFDAEYNYYFSDDDIQYNE